MPARRKPYGIDLSKYVAKERSFNTVLYVKKNLLNSPNGEKRKRKYKKRKQATNFDSEICADNEVGSEGKPEQKHDKSPDRKYVAINLDTITPRAHVKNKNEATNTTLDVNTRGNRQYMPLVIPGTNDEESVIYTIKVLKKSKRHKGKAADEESIKKTERKTTETFRKLTKETDQTVKYNTLNINASSSTTIEELHMNQSLCSSLSEITNNKTCSIQQNQRSIVKKSDVIGFSESFEAMAIELSKNFSDTKIKINLMNDSEKALFTDNIKKPIIQAIKESIADLMNNSDQDNRSELKKIQTNINNSEQKLNVLLNTITKINTEPKVLTYTKATQTIKEDESATETSKAVHFKSGTKSSTLENLGADILEIAEESFDETETESSSRPVRRVVKTPVTALTKHKSRGDILESVLDDKSADLSSDNPNDLPSGKRLHFAPAAANKIPARMCWTDTMKKT